MSISTYSIRAGVYIKVFFTEILPGYIETQDKIFKIFEIFSKI